MNVLQEVRRRHKLAKARGGRGHRLRKAKKILYPMLQERWYQNQIEGLVKAYAEVIRQKLYPAITKAVAGNQIHTPEVLKHDSWADDLNDSMDSTDDYEDRLFGESSVADLATRFATQVSDFNRRQVEKSVSALVGFEVFADEPWLAGQMEAFTNQNVDLIGKLGKEMKGDIGATVMREVAAGTRVEEIQSLIEDRFHVHESRARLIGRDQTNKFNGGLNKLRQTSLGLEKYRWQGVEDERERDSHLDLQDEIRVWGEGIEPGEEIQCRCWAEPVIEGTDLEEAA